MRPLLSRCGERRLKHKTWRPRQRTQDFNEAAADIIITMAAAVAVAVLNPGRLIPASEAGRPVLVNRFQASVRTR